MASFAEVEDLAAWVGQTIGDEDVRALAVLAAASNLIRDEVPDSVADGWEESDGDGIPERVKEITVTVAARVWLNPNAMVQSFSIDDYTERLRESTVEGLFLTKGEADRLSRYRTGHRGLWTLGTTRGDDYADQYLDVVNAATPGTIEEPMPFLPAGQ